MASSLTSLSVLNLCFTVKILKFINPYRRILVEMSIGVGGITLLSLFFNTEFDSYEKEFLSIY